MSAGGFVQWRRWGLGFAVVFESYYKGAWLNFGPLCMWVEL